MSVSIVLIRNCCCVFGMFVHMVLSSQWVLAQEVTSFKSLNNEKSLSSRLSVEGEIVQNVDANWNFDLDDDDKKGNLNLEPTIEFSVSYAVRNNILSYLNLQYGREMEVEYDDEDRERSYKSSLDVEEGFIAFADIFDIDNITRRTSLTVGRFNVSDKREWFYDDSLDGMRVSFELEPIDTRFSLLINREEIFGSDLLSHNDVDPVNNVIVVAEHEPFREIDLEIAAVSIVRHDRSADNNSPMFFGVSARGEFADEQLSFWSDVAWARGEDGDDDIRGFGFDIGATMNFQSPWRPYFTLGYAFGSGDGDIDSDFRQTDLQGNSDKYGGVTSFKYYGELVDPELSNLHIVTAGVGFRYLPDASVDFVLHHYRQDEALDELRSSDLDKDPNGLSRQLGVELDVIWGVELTSNIESELVLGYFKPGSAFRDDSVSAILFEAKLSYSF